MKTSYTGGKYRTIFWKTIGSRRKSICINKHDFLYVYYYRIKRLYLAWSEVKCIHYKIYIQFAWGALLGNNFLK